MPLRIRSSCLTVVVGLLLVPANTLPQYTPAKVSVDWNKVQALSKTMVSIEDPPEPPILRRSPIHDQIYKALRDFHADYARQVPWYTWPKMGVAELKPPENGKTYWDFSLMDETLKTL